jgi:hypothetical protein
MTEQDWPQGYEGHRKAQILWIAENTTPGQRLAWVEEMLRLLYRNGLIPNKMDKCGTWPEPGERR